MHLKCFKKDNPQTLAFIMANDDSQNGIMSNQNFWQKNWQITIDAPKFSSIQYYSHSIESNQ